MLATSSGAAGYVSKKEMSKPFNYKLERWIFLSLLETDLFPRWCICFHGFKLHPADEFPPAALSRKSHRRRCAVRTSEGQHQPPLGIVDVYPCIKLTAREIVKLEKSLRMSPSLIGEGSNEPLEFNGPVISLRPPRRGEI